MRYSDVSPRQEFGLIAEGLVRVVMRPRLLIALALVLIGIGQYYANTESKRLPFTGENVRVLWTAEQEKDLGRQAAPRVLEMFGGELTSSQEKDGIHRIGARLVAAKNEVLRRRGEPHDDSSFHFYVVRDPNTVNAFALPGGHVFITLALLRLLPNESAIAGVLGHEIGHALASHSSQRMARDALVLSTAAAATLLSSDHFRNRRYVGYAVGMAMSTRFGRAEESQSDRIGVQLLMAAGYRPEALIEVMDLFQRLDERSGSPPEFLSSHPYPETRKEQIREYIDYFRADPYRPSE